MTAALNSQILLLVVFATTTNAFSLSAFSPSYLGVKPSLRSSPLVTGGRIPSVLPVLSRSRHTTPVQRLSASFSSRDLDIAKAVALKIGPTALAILLGTSIRIVPPASTGITQTWGVVSERMLDSGPHLMNPFVKVHSFSTKTQLFEQQNHVPTKEGLTVDLDVAVLFRIDGTRARDIYLSLGEKYLDVIVKPELSSAVRSLTSESEAKALYTEGRTTMQQKLKDDLTKALAPRGIIVEDVLLKAVTLPQQLINSIELKAQAEQESARMEFVLTKELQEAERKKIEAKGIADFQKIVSEGISPDLLKWKGVEATEKLANSPNSKIVIVGNSKDSLPVMLSADPSK
eukprot:CAMPEP_0181296946 /NCGR_PEP_ID=MMETSP1101-20121128/4972_1 /TAXON_ID=46948 /ORGANISM="Rhodomonas abbreviata, Strain Caron Lab Isolate" /LENGTH=344 /DNA_ID=CAMNT_0023401839 /DNA_START=50 /DNA_END=1084 /DNA_ORIENTATION=+